MGVVLTTKKVLYLCCIFKVPIDSACWSTVKTIPITEFHNACGINARTDYHIHKCLDFLYVDKALELN